MRWSMVLVLACVGLAAVVVLGGLADGVANAAAPDDDAGDGPGAGPVVGGLVVLGAVFAIGLSAIRRQRAEGRRSKLPPIG